MEKKFRIDLLATQQGTTTSNLSRNLKNYRLKNSIISKIIGGNSKSYTKKGFARVEFPYAKLTFVKHGPTN